MVDGEGGSKYGGVGNCTLDDCEEVRIVNEGFRDVLRFLEQGDKFPSGSYEGHGG